MSGGPEPEVFGEYELLEKIATGGMAEVYRARKHGAAGFEKIVVIKKILPELARDEEFLQLFQDEARITSRLMHVNIVQVFDYSRLGEEYFIAMEYVHGLDLARLLLRARNLGSFPIPLALLLCAEVLKALVFAHSRTGEDGAHLGLVHCDISPQNILVSYAGEVKLTDFGISRAAFQASNQHQVIRGKYAYMAPEQIEGRAVDARTDLFSLAIVLYEALTGKRLFKARTREKTLARVRRAEVPSPRAARGEISEDLEGFLLRALARRPEDRFQSAEEMLEALTAIRVREGHRASNNDLAAYLKDVVDSAQVAEARGGEDEDDRPARHGRVAPPSALVCLAVEASPPPRSIAAPRTSLAHLGREWAGIVHEAGGDVWERTDGSLLIVWIARGGLRDSLSRAVATADALQKATLAAGYRLSAGVAPGVARIAPETGRPADGWELAGPFYLARWMMNLSAHRGRVLLTEVGANQVRQRTSLLGRIPIQGNRYINLYELGA